MAPDLQLVRRPCSSAGLCLRLLSDPPPPRCQDPAIRNWVLLPIFAAMFLISVARHYAQKLMRTDTKVDVKALKEAQAVTRAQRLRGAAAFVPAGAVSARRAYFCDKEARLLGACAATPL